MSVPYGMSLDIEAIGASTRFTALPAFNNILTVVSRVKNKDIIISLFFYVRPHGSVCLNFKAPSKRAQ